MPQSKEWTENNGHFENWGLLNAYLNKMEETHTPVFNASTNKTFFSNLQLLKLDIIYMSIYIVKRRRFVKNYICVSLLV